jgi:hypothetical protein
MTLVDPEQLLTDADFRRLQLTTLQYYLHETNPANGLIRDKTDKNAPASIAAIGLALASLPILTEHRVISREFAPEIALKRLRFFATVRTVLSPMRQVTKASTTTFST